MLNMLFYVINAHMFTVVYVGHVFSMAHVGHREVPICVVGAITRLVHVPCAFWLYYLPSQSTFIANYKTLQGPSVLASALWGTHSKRTGDDHFAKF